MTKRKNILIVSILFIVLIISTLCGKQSAIGCKEKYLLDSILVKDSNQYISKYIFEYDEKGRQIKAVSYDWLQSLNKWIGKMKIESEYNDKDSLIKRQDFFWREEIWNKASQEEFIYENYQLVSEKTWSESNNITTTTTYFYDENGNKIKSLKADSTGYFCESEFDHKGNIISKIINRAIGHCYSKTIRDGIICDTSFSTFQKYKDVYLYNDKNLLKQVINYEWDEKKNDWIEQKEEQDEYDYDHKGNLLSKKGKSWMNEYCYDENNRKTSEVLYYKYKNDWTIERKVEFEFDKDGNNISETTRLWNSERRIERKFDKNKNEILFIEDDSKWGKRKYEYFYDENNNKTLDINYFFDSDSKEWKEIHRAEFFYRKANY